jgi:hypothetical protein
MPGKKLSTCCLKQSINVVLGTPTYADELELRRECSETVGGIGCAREDIKVCKSVLLTP